MSRVTSFLLYPKHAQIMQAAADKVADGNFSLFAAQAIERLADEAGITTGQISLERVPPLRLLSELRYLDRYLLSLLQLLLFLRQHAHDDEVSLPAPLRDRAIALVGELLQQLAARPPEPPSGPHQPVETQLLEGLIESLLTSSGVRRGKL